MTCISGALELGIFASHLIWLYRTKTVRKEAATQGKTFDDLAAEYEEQGIEFRFAERSGRGNKDSGQHADDGPSQRDLEVGKTQGI